MLNFVKNNILSLTALAAVLKVFSHNRFASVISKALGAFTGSFRKPAKENTKNGKS